LSGRAHLGAIVERVNPARLKASFTKLAQDKSIEDIMRFHSFLSASAGSTHILYSMIAGAIAIVAALSAFVIDHQIKNHNGLAYAAAVRLVGSSDAKSPNSSAGVTTLHQYTIDYTPTGSTPTSLVSGQIVLDPCTGARKN
jgi:hypothetical protein